MISPSSPGFTNASTPEAANNPHANPWVRETLLILAPAASVALQRATARLLAWLEKLSSSEPGAKG